MNRYDTYVQMTQDLCNKAHDDSISVGQYLDLLTRACEEIRNSGLSVSEQERLLQAAPFFWASAPTYKCPRLAA